MPHETIYYDGLISGLVAVKPLAHYWDDITGTYEFDVKVTTRKAPKGYRFGATFRAPMSLLVYRSHLRDGQIYVSRVLPETLLSMTEKGAKP